MNGFSTQLPHQDGTKADCYNVGPTQGDCVTTGDLVALFCKLWGETASWRKVDLENQPHEANFLKLDCSKLNSAFAWSPKWSIEEALTYTVEWSKVYLAQGDLEGVTRRQIREYLQIGENP